MRKNIAIILGVLVIVGTSFLAGYSAKNLFEIRQKLQDSGEKAKIQSGCGEITIGAPGPGTIIQSPLAVSGEAIGTWFFEANAGVHVVDATGKELGRGYVTARDDWMTENCVPFTGTLEFQPSETETGEVVFANDNPSGNPETQRESRVPVKFEKILTRTVKVFFNNTDKDPNLMDCSKVYPVERNVPKTEAVARAALEALFRGPTVSESSDGYLTNLPQGVIIQRLVIENGTAKADFDEALERNSGGSCRVAAQRAQITETLKQFPTVKDAVISINGRTEDILQP